VNKREAAAHLLGNRVVQPFWRLMPGSGALRILAYHRVLDDDLSHFPFDEQLISATSDDFRRQMQFLKRHFEVISFADLHECEKAGRPWPRRAAIVTFDDGYADNYTHAFPILKELHLPATIFLATGFLEHHRLFWWDLLAYCFKHSPLSQVHLPEAAKEPLPLRCPSSRRLAINRVLLWIKSVPDERKNEFLDRLPELMEVTLPADAGHNLQLSWEQVREMAAHGIEFGGHSVTHPILSNVSAEQLCREVEGSKRDIETNLGAPPIVFSFPNGQSNPAVQDAVLQAGYPFSAAYFAGIANQQDGCHAMPRIPVETDFSFALFQANLLFPAITLRGLTA
jgi:peptidoglycan/xylan/chitin deacetylase (PgdA/CDA1 family)